MRLVILCMLFAISMAAWGSLAQDFGFKHDWLEEPERAEKQNRFISKHSAPFSGTVEPEATLTAQAGRFVPEDIPLPEMLKAEIADIRKGRAMANYLDDLDEKGSMPDGDIVSYIEKIDGHPVGFIKYRVAGIGKKALAHPRSVIHAMFLYKSTIVHIHLSVLFPGHLEEVMGDQLRLVRAVFKRWRPHRARPREYIDNLQSCAP